MEMDGISIMRGAGFRHSEGERDQLADLFVSTPFYIVRFIAISTPLNLDGSYNNFTMAICSKPSGDPYL
jgi:hypothetical protein